MTGGGTTVNGMTTLVTHDGQLKKVGPKTPADLEARLERALKQIRDLERELGEVLDRLSVLEGRPPLRAA
jgi:hypothetical protein